MSFVREAIAEADIAAYGLRAINDQWYVLDFGNGWVIDRERGIYLRWLASDREDPGAMTFSYFWKGSLLTLGIASVSTEPYDESTTTWALSAPIELPPELEATREQITEDLRDALSVWGSFGLMSGPGPHNPKFAF